MVRVLGALIVWIALANHATAQVVIDGFFDDWSPILAEQDRRDDHANGIDIVAVKVTDDEERLYVQLELDREINIQEESDLTVYVDVDSDPTTGFSVSSLGYDLAYFISQDRGVIIQDGQANAVGFVETGFVVLPSISSTTFELTLLKEVVAGDSPYAMTDQIRIVVRDNEGLDTWPDFGGFDYDMQSAASYENTATLEQPDRADFRIVSYNSLFDGLFGSRGDRQAAYMETLAPDIMIWQELFEANNPRMRSALGAVTAEWETVHVATSSGTGLALVSRFPILDEVSIDGNAAYAIDLITDTLLLVHVHYPCCDKDFERQAEVDRVMQFIRQVQEGSADLEIDQSPPIVLMGDMNLVGRARQYRTMIEGDIVSNVLYGPDYDPDYDGSHLADAVPKVLGGNLAYTWFDPPSGFSPGRLDLSLYTDSRLEVVNTFCYQPSFDQPSDHLPIVVDYSLLGDPVSVDKTKQADSWVVFPQPASDRLYIRGNNDYHQLSLYDMTGHLVYQTSDRQSTVDVSSVKAGSYLLSIVADGIVHTQAVVIK